MHRGLRKPCGLKVSRYTDSLIDLNVCFSSLPRSLLSEKNCIIELNKILLNIIPNSWSKQADVQGFYCEFISLKKAANVF